jgi:hypothetical protein
MPTVTVDTLEEVFSQPPEITIEKIDTKKSFNRAPTIKETPINLIKKVLNRANTMKKSDSFKSSSQERRDTITFAALSAIEM